MVLVGDIDLLSPSVDNNCGDSEFGEGLSRLLGAVVARMCPGLPRVSPPVGGDSREDYTILGGRAGSLPW